MAKEMKRPKQREQYEQEMNPVEFRECKPRQKAVVGRFLRRMRASMKGRDELAATVQQVLAVPTKEDAKHIVDVVIGSLEATLLNNLETDGFTLKLGSFGKFSVRHSPGILRKIGFTGQTILTKDKRKVRFVSLGNLRRREKVDCSAPALTPPSATQGM
jgi:nucleoid DNA-binding protein